MYYSGYYSQLLFLLQRAAVTLIMMLLVNATCVYCYDNLDFLDLIYCYYSYD